MAIQILRTLCVAIVTVFAVSGCGSKVHDEKSGELDFDDPKVVTIDTPDDELHFEKSGELDFGESKVFMIDAPKSQQKVVVKLTSDDEVNVTVALTKDIDGDLLKRDRKALGESKVTKIATIEAAVPAGQAFTVILTTVKKKTSFKLTIDSV